MAHISTEDVKIIRQKLKKEFPSLKFSVTRQHGSTVKISIMEGNLDFGTTEHVQFNTYHLDFYKHEEVLERILDIANNGSSKKNFDHSDSQTDYFYVGFYVDIDLGKWDRPYKFIG